MKVTIQSDSDVEFCVDTNEETTVRSLKGEIYKISDIKCEVNLLFNNVVLPNAARVFDFAGENDSLKLVLNSDRNINISVNTPTKVFRTTISNSCTVGKLKVIFFHEYQVRIPLVRQILRNDLGNVMDDDSMPVHWYGVKDRSFLDLDSRTIRVRICCESGETLQVLVDPSVETIKDLKRKICSLSLGNSPRESRLRDFEFLTLFLNVSHGDQFDELLDSKTLMDYNVTRKSLIYLLSYTWVDESLVSMQLANVVTEQALPRDHRQVKGFSSRSNSASSTTVKQREDYIVFGERISMGCQAGDTLLSVGLRIQEQLGVAYNAQEFAVLNKAALQKLSAQGCVSPENMFTIRESTVLPLKGAVNNVPSSAKLTPKTCYLLFISDTDD